MRLSMRCNVRLLVAIHFFHDSVPVPVFFGEREQYI